MNHLYVGQKHKTSYLKKLEPRHKSKIAFSTQEGIHIVDTNDILFLSASSNYTQVNLRENKKIIVSKTLSTIAVHLPQNQFKRCHRSYIVNVEEIVQLNDSIILTSEDEIPISRRKRNEFTSWIAKTVTFV